MLTAEDRLDILDMLARTNASADAKDVEGHAAFYTADGEITGAYAVRAGADFRGDLKKVFDAEGTLKRHVGVNHSFEGSGDRATVKSLLIVFEGEQAPVLVATCAIRDDLRKIDGKWRIARHEVNIDPSMKIDVGQKKS